MSKKKIFLFFALIILFGSAIIIPHYLNTKNNRDVEDNTAKGVILEEGKYIVGKDIKPGVYDIICISNKGEYWTSKFDKGERLVGKQLFKNNEFDIIKGNFKLVPTSFQPLKINENGNYELIFSGMYTIGKEVPEGKYKIFIKNKSIMSSVRVELLSENYSDGISLLSTDTKQEEFIFSCEKGQIISVPSKVNVLKEEDSNIIIVLEPEK